MAEKVVFFNPPVQLRCVQKETTREWELRYYFGSPDDFAVLGGVVTSADTPSKQAMEQIVRSIIR